MEVQMHKTPQNSPSYSWGIEELTPLFMNDCALSFLLPADSPEVWIVVGFSCFAVIMIMLLAAFAWLHQRRKRARLRDLSRWQTETWHQWINDAEMKFKVSQGIPAAFLIAKSDIKLVEEWVLECTDCNRCRQNCLKYPSYPVLCVQVQVSIHISIFLVTP